jgi:crotonobetainyl-CoA:carnitine CoA-transferase CaiB-like acyl-CoA transferase
MAVQRSQIRTDFDRQPHAALAQKSAAEWSALFNAHGVPAGEVLDVPSVLTHPQVTSRALVKT